MSDVHSEERWKPVLGYEFLYDVSSLGRVRSLYGRLPDGAVMKDRDSLGYRRVSLRRDGKYKDIMVHRLVANAFLGAKENMEVNHIDGDKSNNRLSNLEWTTHVANMEHAIINGLSNTRGESSGNSKLKDIQVLEILASRDTIGEIAKKYGMSVNAIGNIRTGKTWRHITKLGKDRLMTLSDRIQSLNEGEK